MAVHNIVVVGANFAGLGTAHYLLKHTIPALEEANDKSTKYKLTLISPSTHFYFKIGSPRILASPDLIPFSKAFLPLKDGFNAYPADRFSLVIGEAVALDEEKKTVTVEDTYSASPSNITVNYSTLVLATGASANSPLWNLKGSHENTVAALKEMHDALPEAKTILIAGGGPAGVETAGELATLYPSASITLLSGSSRLLPRLRSAISSAAESQLKGLSVTVLHNLKIVSPSPTESKPTNTTLHLSDNTTRNVDVYIDATGTRPNTSFLPPHWLTESRHVRTEDKLTLRGPAPNVYAIGDVAGYSLGNIFDINDAVRPLASSVYQDLSGKQPTSKPFAQNTKETQLVPIGPNGGVGAAYGWRLPSFAVKMIKSKDFMIKEAPKAVSGEQFAKA